MTGWEDYLVTDWKVNGRQARIANRFKSRPYGAGNIQITYDLVSPAAAQGYTLSAIEEAYAAGRRREG